VAASIATASRREPALHHQRRAFEFELGARAEIIGLEFPCNFQLVEVARVDLIERRIPRAAEIPAVGAPFAVLRA